MAPKIPDEEEEDESLDPNSSEVKEEEEDDSAGFLPSMFFCLSDNPHNPKTSLYLSLCFVP